MAFQDILQSARQFHHDYYVRLYREGKLSPEIQPQYDLAMKREKEGLVKPLENNNVLPSDNGPNG